MSKNQIRTASSGAGAAKAVAKSNVAVNQKQQQKPQQQQKNIKKEVVAPLPSVNDVPSLSWLFPEASETVAQNAPQVRTVAKVSSQPKVNSSNQAKKNQVSSVQSSKKSAGDWSSNLTGLSLLYPEVVVNTSEHQLRIVSSKQNQKPAVNVVASKQNQKPAIQSDRQVRVVASKQAPKQNKQPSQKQVLGKGVQDWSANLINLAEFFPEIAINVASKQVRVVAASQAQNNSQQAQKLPRAQKLAQPQSKGSKKNASDWSANLNGLESFFPDVQVNAQAKQVRVISENQSRAKIHQDLQSSGLQKVSSNQAVKSQQNASGSNQRKLDTANSARGNSVQKLSGNDARANVVLDHDKELEEISWLFPEQFSRLPEVSRKEGATLLRSQQKLGVDKVSSSGIIVYGGNHQNVVSAGPWSGSQSRGLAGTQQKSGMIGANSNIRSMGNSHDHGSSSWPWNSGAKASVGSGSGLSDWHGLLAALNSIIIVSNSRRAYSGENNPVNSMKGPSISEFHRGTCGHFFSVDCVSSDSNPSAILAGTSLNSRIRHPDCLDEAIRWRKHVLDRG